MTSRRTPLWLYFSLALPLVTIVIAAALVMRGEREAMLRAARMEAQRACDAAVRDFTRSLAGMESRPLPLTDELGRLREDEFLYPETPSPLAKGEAQDWFAHGEFTRVMKDAPHAMSEAGLPLGPLCAWQLMRKGANLSDAWRILREEAIIKHPSLLSQSLLEAGEALLKKGGWTDDEIESSDVWRRWRDDEMLREVIRSHEKELRNPVPRSFGCKPGDRNGGRMALVFHADDLLPHRPPDVVGWRIALTPASQEMTGDLVTEAVGKLPAFVGFRIWQFPASGSDPLASNEHLLAAAGTRLVRASAVYAENLLFQQAVWQHLRWTGGALALAFIVCALGAWQILRGYRRQQQLAEQQSNFISSVSHELRAPLSSVRLMAESLCDGTVTETERVAEYHRVMHEESTRLCSLVENVLDTARIERGVKTYTFVPCDPVSLIESATRILSPRAERQQVRWSIECASFEPLPQADENALRQALVNLIDNALKHSPEHTMITIKAAPINDDHWSLSVADQGPGIPASERERVFERFYRIGSELRRETTGAGLGLALVKHVVEGHGGSVSISEAPGGGAMVTMTFPNSPLSA